MAEALSDKTIEIVKSTVPALEAGGTAITDRMYQLMFRHAEVRALFNQSHHGETGSQSKALTAAVIAYARNIDNLGVLASRIERITQKHCGLNILPEHYHLVAESLLALSRTCWAKQRRRSCFQLGARLTGFWPMC